MDFDKTDATWRFKVTNAPPDTWIYKFYDHSKVDKPLNGYFWNPHRKVATETYISLKDNVHCSYTQPGDCGGIVYYQNTIVGMHALAGMESDTQNRPSSCVYFYPMEGKANNKELNDIEDFCKPGPVCITRHLGGIGNFPLPDELLVVPGDLDIRIGSDLIQIDCPVVSICSYFRWFDPKKLAAGCFSTWEYVLLVVLVVLAMILFAVFLWAAKSLWKFGIVLCTPCIFIISLVYKVFRYCIWRVRARYNAVNKGTYGFLIFMLVLGPLDSFVLKAQDKHCEIRKNQKLCTYMDELLLQDPVTGRDYHGHLEHNDKVIGTVKIIVHSLVMECAKTFMYFVPGKGEVVTHSYLHCKFGGGGCNSHSYCNDYRDPNKCPERLKSVCTGKKFWSQCHYGNSAHCHYCFFWQNCINAAHVFDNLRIPYSVSSCAA